MLFIGIALLISIGLTLIIVSDAGSLAGLTQEQSGQIIALIMVLLLVGSGLFSKRIKFSEIITSIILWIIVFSIIIIGYIYKEEIGIFASRVAGGLAPSHGVVSKEKSSVSFNRSIDGSFKINAYIDNVKIKMIFDTGASLVVLSHDDAIKIGLDINNLDYKIPVETANGITKAAPIILENIRVGNIKRNNIKAFVAKDNLLKTSLLGMSFLETLSGYSVGNDRLVLLN